jgi:hypothetical protein
MTTPTTSPAEDVRCAYCRKVTPPERRAAPPWTWPGRGLVTNCHDCAGIEVCDAGHEFDSSISDTCPTCGGAIERAEELYRQARRFRDEAAHAVEVAVERGVGMSRADEERTEADGHLLDAAQALLAALGYGEEKPA